MEFLGKLAVIISAFALFASAAEAGQAGKIYLNGSWKEAAQPVAEEEVQAFSLGSLFGSKSPVSITQMVRHFLTENASLLNTDSQTSWGVTQQHNGAELQTQRLQKTWMGLPVLGGDAVVHVADGKIAFANADNTRLDQLVPTARIQPEEARTMAFASYNGRALYTSAPQLKVLILGNGANKVARLVYEVTVRDRDGMASDIHFIDAQTAQEVMVTTNVETLDREVVSAGGSEADFDLDETKWTKIYSEKGCNGQGELFASANPSPCNQTDSRIGASALFAWTNSGLVANYYQNVHHRNSLDGNGMTLTSVVNFGGTSFANAAWYNDRSVMLYGLGDENNMNDFASPLDVVAHEMTHGVTAHTANLEYSDQSGALNESYSDVFGKLVAYKFGKANDWKLGKDLFKDGQRFVRDMENPEVGHMNDYKYKGESCNRFNDFCGVHTNSGIPSKAAVILAKKIGLDKLGKIYYLTLTQLLRTNSDFQEAKAQTQAACSTLFGERTADCAAVADAFSQVGI